MTAGRHGRSALLARASTGTALLVVSTISSLVGLVFALPAVVFGLIAVIAERRHDPRAPIIARWGWGAYVVGAVLMLAWGVVLVVVAGFAASGSG